jgi:hypothetical protein
MTITEVGNIGYDGYRVIEKDTGTDNWRHYWVKAEHVHEEINIGGLSHETQVSESTVQEMESRLESEPSENPNPVPSVTVGDVLPDFIDYGNLPTRRDGSIDFATLENDPENAPLPENFEAEAGE